MIEIIKETYPEGGLRLRPTPRELDEDGNLNGPTVNERFVIKLLRLTLDVSPKMM